MHAWASFALMPLEKKRDTRRTSWRMKLWRENSVRQAVIDRRSLALRTSSLRALVATGGSVGCSDWRRSRRGAIDRGPLGGISRHADGYPAQIGARHETVGWPAMPPPYSLSLCSDRLGLRWTSPGDAGTSRDRETPCTCYDNLERYPSKPSHPTIFHTGRRRSSSVSFMRAAFDPAWRSSSALIVIQARRGVDDRTTVDRRGNAGKIRAQRPHAKSCDLVALGRLASLRDEAMIYRAEQTLTEGHPSHQLTCEM